ncbi:MAG: hypothetical protein AAGD04_13000 [Pseudomonadota bacterium]
MNRMTFAASVAASFAATSAFGQATEPFHLGRIYLGSSSSNETSLSQEDLDRIDPTDLQDVFRSEPTIAVGSSLPISQKAYVNGVVSSPVVHYH